MIQNGGAIDESLIETGDFTYVSGMQCAVKLLGHKDPPQAIFACNDDMAAGAIAGAHRSGLRVPEDLTVVGFDDTQIASSNWPTITTVRQPIREMAKSAINLLGSSDVEETKSKKTVLLSHELIERKSSAPPARSTSYKTG